MTQESQLVNGLTPAQLETCRKLLEEQKVEVLARLQRHEEPTRALTDSLPDEIDQANHDADQALTLRFLEKERKLLAEVDHALAKLRGDTYGLCEGTEEPIEPRRLLARPWARYSLAFKEQLEREERGFAK